MGIKLEQIYKCEVCGNIVEVVHAGAGDLVCCGQNMKIMEENTVDAATEKHVPVIELYENGVIIKVGEVPHPMEEKHYIEFIELIVDGKVYRQHLKPGDKPEAFFPIAGKAFFPVTGSNMTAREYCNLHGLWKKE